MESPKILIDGKNCLYRAIFANQAQKDQRHHLTVMLRIMQGWMLKFKPDSVHVFWDCPRSKVWRKQVMPEYKERPSTGRVDISDELLATLMAAKAVFKQMGIRQYHRKEQEADDLIYAACRMMSPDPIIIVSSDEDYTQISYAMPNVSIWRPIKNKMDVIPDHNPVIKKALMGDKSDAIDGYRGIGKVKATRMARLPQDRQTFLEANDRMVFLRNMLLIDLSLCPHVLANDTYVMKIMSGETEFDHSALLELVSKFKIRGLRSEFTDLVLPYKALQNSDGEI